MILDGKGLSEQIQAQVALEVANLKAQGILPKLCVILVGENPASISYVNMKKKACERTGIESQIIKFDENIAQKALLDEIARLNADKSVSGILVQLPLPKHIDTSAVLEAIWAKKDVDGFHPYNVGRLVAQTCNSSLTRPSRELEKFSFDRQPALSQSNFSAQPTNLTQDTRIANNSNDSSLRDSQRKSKQSTKNQNANFSIVSEKSGLCSCEQGNKTDSLLTKRTTKQGKAEVSLSNLPDLSPQDEFATAPIPLLAPATPLGIMELLKAYDIAVSGKNVAIIGASNIVGKPLSALMLNAGATISVCHILTKDISVFTKSADIVCVGVGKVNLITADMIKDGAIVIDIGINKVNGKIKGDVDFESVSKKVSFITPVPGGVGPMTIAMLLKNTILCAQILANLPCGVGALSPSLAKGDKGGGYDTQKNSGAKFTNSDFTHPLTPSAREGEHNVKSSTNNIESHLLSSHNAKNAEFTSKGQK